jgi:hypothetical protein
MHRLVPVPLLLLLLACLLDIFQGVPPSLTIHPYEAVYAAGLVGFPTALILGLGCVHRDPDDVLLDYRVRGCRLVKDLWPRVGAIHRQMNALAERISDPSTTLYEMDELMWEFHVLEREGKDATALVQELVAGVSEGGGEVVELWALTIGVRPAVQPPFPEPGYLTVAADGLGLPPEHADQATLAIHWELIESCGSGPRQKTTRRCRLGHVSRAPPKRRPAAWTMYGTPRIPPTTRACRR